MKPFKTICNFDTKNLKIVDGFIKLKRCLDILNTYKLLMIDIEGIDLCRYGKIAIIQIATPDDKLYLIDIIKLGKKAFEVGLKNLLENENIEKIFYDVRVDCDSLYHLFGVLPKNIIDLQVIFMTTGGKINSPYVEGLQKAINQVFGNFSEKNKYNKMKETGKKLYAPELGGSFEIWNKRPLDKQLIKYMIADTTLLYKLYISIIERSMFELDEIKKISIDRAQKILRKQKYKKGKCNAYRDWIDEEYDCKEDFCLSDDSSWNDKEDFPDFI